MFVLRDYPVKAPHYCTCFSSKDLLEENLGNFSIGQIKVVLFPITYLMIFFQIQYPRPSSRDRAQGLVSAKLREFAEEKGEQTDKNLDLHRVALHYLPRLETHSHGV